MTTFPVFTWALSLALVEFGLGFLLVCLAVAVRLWPTRPVKAPRLTVKRKEHPLVRHFRRLFGSKDHPRHPSPPAPTLPS